MNLAALQTQWEKALEALSECGLVALVNGHLLKPAADGGRTLRSTSIEGREEYPRGRFSRIEEYIFALKWGEYSAVLFDGSVLQIEYTVVDGDVTKHRLSYFPCPIEIDLTSTHSFDEPLDQAVMQVLAAGDPKLVRPFAAIRFDYDRDVSDEKHPMSHFSFISADCRMPVQSPVGLKRFLAFVFGNFYGDRKDDWSAVIDELHFDFPSSILDHESQLTHLAWKSPPVANN